MPKPLDQKQLKTIQEEIRTRVFERYAELQGVETQKTELNATLEALHEITHLPVAEIEKIAAEVTHTHEVATIPTNTPMPQVEDLAPAKDFTFEPLRQQVQKKRRAFIPHLISYTCVGGILIFLNIISTSFPWAIFPLLGWGIGLGSHFFEGVYWPAADLKEKIKLIKSQIHQILLENLPAYQASAQGKIFNGVYRLLVSGSPQTMLNDYIKNVDPRMLDNEVQQVTTQLCAIRDGYLQTSANELEEKHHKHYRKQLRHGELS